MGSVRTAISIPESLAKQVDRAARKMRISRSQLFARAAEEFLLRRRGDSMRESYDRAYADGLTGDDETFLRHARGAARRLAEREQW